VTRTQPWRSFVAVRVCLLQVLEKINWGGGPPRCNFWVMFATIGTRHPHSSPAGLVETTAVEEHL
jgi:hypothetical protein